MINDCSTSIAAPFPSLFQNKVMFLLKIMLTKDVYLLNTIERLTSDLLINYLKTSMKQLAGPTREDEPLAGTTRVAA